jgi:hypothetical protein
MMSRAYIYILLGFFLIGAADLSFATEEPEILANNIVERPVVAYQSGQLRDPFKAYIIKEEPVPVILPESSELTNPTLNLNRFTVQGIIWGVKVPQAIINNQVLTIGDLIEGAEILSIEKSGVTLIFSGSVYNLKAPGQGFAHAEQNNREE